MTNLNGAVVALLAVSICGFLTDFSLILDIRIGLGWVFSVKGFNQ
jgi:hypothetical protein